MKPSIRHVAALVSCALAVMASMASAAHAQEPLTVPEEIALARINEIRALGDPIQRLSWPDFEPASAPAIFYEPDAWAIAVGFDAPPEGFGPIAGRTDAGRQVYRAGRGAFHAGSRSPALISGRWTVLSRFDPAEAAPAGDRMGRPAAEEAIDDFMRDAFMIHLMTQRKRATPLPTGTAAYPASAELMALTSLENRALVTPLQTREVTERNLEDYRRRVKEVVAIRHAREKLMGAELTELERGIEMTDGLGYYTATLAPRQALNAVLAPSDLGKTDGTFRDFSHAVQLRALMVNYPLSFTADNPDATQPQIAWRAAALATLLDRIDAKWRPRALKAEAALIDLLAEKQEVKPEDEAALLATAKTDYQYDAVLKLAGYDLERVTARRGETLSKLFPSPGKGEAGRLEIRLDGAPVEAYLDDPAATRHLGDGRLLHAGSLTLKAPGLSLAAAPRPQESPRVMTRAGARRDALSSIVVGLAGVEATLGGRKPKPGGAGRKITTEDPLLVKAPGFSLTVTSGRVSEGPDGSLQVDMGK